MKLLFKFIWAVFPEVDKELNRWIEQSRLAGDDVLKKQALSSISKKKFHAQGGAVYSLYPGVSLKNSIKFIVSFQTISDYLDNLCDRAGVLDEAAFRQLHMAMMDAVSPDSDTHDYYLYYPYKNDNGYLSNLVEECRRRIRDLPSYKTVAGPIKKYVQLYSCLQTYKHLEPAVRETCLKGWADLYLNQYSDVYWWEFSAATGSTLGIFLMFAIAHDMQLTAGEVKSIEEAYFPWVCGLHILLDYYIDSSEDMLEGDLNFTGYYKNLMQCEERIAFFIERSFTKCKNLRYPEFHCTIINGLLAMYLSDTKAASGTDRSVSRSLVKEGGVQAVLYHKICRLLRDMGKL